jgi:hypothetical protein
VRHRYDRAASASSSHSTEPEPMAYDIETMLQRAVHELGRP